MKNAGTKRCPSCAREIPFEATLCGHCGKSLQAMRLADSRKAETYKIVSDGLKFGIAVGGDIKIHGLEWEKAQKLVEILNSVTKIEDAG